jgi:hypothetical protein
MLQKIISGGQTGADQAGLQVGLRLGIPTGGWAPARFMTEQGPRPELLRDTFGLTELIGGNYRDRTIQNIKDADLTIVFDEVGSVGSQLTFTQAELMHKPVLKNPSAQLIRNWLAQDPTIAILNVAGNRASVSPGIHARVYDILFEALSPAKAEEAS